jgi:hypothetical protein
MVMMGKAQKIVIETPERKKVIGETRRRCENNIKILSSRYSLWTGLKWLKVASSGGFGEHGDEFSGTVKKCGIFFAYQKTANFLRKPPYQ